MLPVSEKLLTSEFDYHLPKELIAQQPAAVRSDSRLMVVDRQNQSIEHTFFRNLAEYLLEGDALAINDSRVVPAKLVGYRKDTRGRWHGLWLENESIDGDAEANVVRLMCKSRSKLQPGHVIMLQDREGRDFCELSLLVRLPGGTWAAKLLSELGIEQVLAQIGRVPLPHYIRGGRMVDADFKDYQTVYAKYSGSIAAPTAGLHFTQNLIRDLVDQGIAICPLTLHVGVGTFRPISGDRLCDHKMHAESGTVSAEAARRLNQARTSGKRVVAVGTTVTRILETAASDDGQIQAWSGETDLFITPGFRFRAIDALITNFHLPRSTLLVLVRAFGGDELMRHAYQTAIENRYRFFSYGDAMLIL